VFAGGVVSTILICAISTDFGEPNVVTRWTRGNALSLLVIENAQLRAALVSYR